MTVHERIQAHIETCDGCGVRLVDFLAGQTTCDHGVPISEPCVECAALELEA